MTEGGSEAPDTETLGGPPARHGRERTAWETHVGLLDPVLYLFCEYPTLCWDGRFQGPGPGGIFHLSTAKEKEEAIS